MTVATRPSWENQLVVLTLSASVPPALIVLAMMWRFDTSLYLQGLVAIFLLALIANATIRIRERATYQARSIINLLGAMIQGDYAMRARQTTQRGPQSELMALLNQLAETLSLQQQSSEESRQLLRRVIDQIDVAIIAFDQKDQVVLTNPAASTLLGDSLMQRLLPDSLLFAKEMTAGETIVLEESEFRKGGRFRIHLEQFRLQGHVHYLLFISDVMGMLRAEERRVWQNLVRVLSHEINNSLSPIVSISNTLQQQLTSQDVLANGLKVIEDRAFSLKQFIQQYRTLAQLPEPEKSPVSLPNLVDVVCGLFETSRLQLNRGPDVTLFIDSNQVKQLLVNLVKNALEAIDDQSAVVFEWDLTQENVMFRVLDCGPGIANEANLFVPFYSTKPDGSGVGLVLSRQIAEAHGGYLTLENRESGGCVATVVLPRR